MKQITKLCYLILVSSCVMFTNCTSEYKAIPGHDGIDGVDGLDGLDGQDASAAACISCHSNSHRDPIHAALEISGLGSFRSSLDTFDSILSKLGLITSIRPKFMSSE